MKATGWAVVRPDGRIVAFDDAEGDCWVKAVGAHSAAEIAAWTCQGYRCVPVTIEWRE
jgi:hypothetical protein